MPIIQEAIATGNDRYKKNVRLSPVGIVLHSVGTPQPSAEVFVRLWKNNSSPYFTHYVLDDQDIYHTMPNDRQCAHVGGPGNSKYLGVEMCEPKQIKYTSGAKFNVTDKAAAHAYAKACYENAVWLFAKICKEYGWNPYTAILTHNEVTKNKLSNTNHVDPEHLWKGLGLPYTLDTFREAVAAEIGAEKPVVAPSASPTLKTTRTLKNGTNGDDVKQLQTMLTTYGYDVGSKGANGYFGNDTEAAVILFQKEHTDKNGNPLDPDGKVGPATRWSINNEAKSRQTKETITLDMARNVDPELAGTYTVTARGGLNIRSGAGTEKDLIGFLPYGAKASCYGYYNVAGNGRKWLYITSNASGKSMVGYCSDLYLKK